MFEFPFVHERTVWAVFDPDEDGIDSAEFVKRDGLKSKVNAFTTAGQRPEVSKIE